MKKLVFSSIILVFVCYIALHIYFVSIPVSIDTGETGPARAGSGGGKAEESAFGFVDRLMVQKDGSILSNLQGSAAGSYTLSESVGLLMNYCVMTGRKDLFDREVSFLRSRLLVDSKYIKWRAGRDEANCNAAIDDLRIIGALLDAHEKWGSKEYYDLAGFLQEGLSDSQVAGRDLYEFYDWKSQKSKHAIPLCYLDLYTVDRLSDFNKGWLSVEEKAISVVSGGRINDSSPFYFKYYDYDSGGYTFDEEYRKDGGICLTYTLYTALHMAEVNEENSFLTEWLKGEVKNGKLYAWYNPHTLKPVNNMESTAVYALAAVYARKTGETELYDQLINAMSKLMVEDKNSKYYGGFGDAKTLSFYSFDNLTALWAYALGGR